MVVVVFVVACGDCLPHSPSMGLSCRSRMRALTLRSALVVKISLLVVWLWALQDEGALSINHCVHKSGCLLRLICVSGFVVAKQIQSRHVGTCIPEGSRLSPDYGLSRAGHIHFANTPPNNT